MMSDVNKIPIYVTVQLPLEQYKMAVGIAHAFRFENFDEYLTALVVQDLETLRDGGEHLADCIKQIMPEKEKEKEKEPNP